MSRSGVKRVMVMAAEVRPRPPREPGGEAWSHVASLIGAHAMSGMQPRMRESYHDAAFCQNRHFLERLSEQNHPWEFQSPGSGPKKVSISPSLITDQQDVHDKIYSWVTLLPL